MLAWSSPVTSTPRSSPTTTWWGSAPASTYARTTQIYARSSRHSPKNDDPRLLSSPPVVFPDKGIHRFSRPLVQLLEQKGFDVVAAFSSRAWDTYLPFKPFGGIRKGRPNADDLESARTFAEVLRGSVQDSLPGTG